MDMYSILIAAVCGGLAAWVARLIFGGDISNKAGYLLVTAALFVGFFTFSKIFVVPKLSTANHQAEIESSFEQIPAFASLKQYEPVAYQQMLDALAEAMKNGYSQQQAIAVARTHLSSLIEARLPHASDEAIVTYTGVMVSEMGELQSMGGDMCFRFLFPQPGEAVSNGLVFSAEVQQQDLAALDEVIKTSNTKRPVPSQQMVVGHLQTVFGKLYEQYGDDVAMLETPTAGNLDKDKMCRITRDMYAHILAMPEQQAADTLRWMYGQL